MRQPKSLFNKACQFINSIPVGSAFSSKEYISAIGKYENATWWKNVNGNKHYNCHQYKGYLKKAGFISKVEHGIWMVERHIPEWFDFGHLSILLGYYKWTKQADGNFGPVKSYKGMERIDIIAQLDEDAHRAMGLIPPLENTAPKKKKKMAKLYKFNREAYQTFISRCRFIDVDKFDTKNKLAAFIEDCKWPGVGNDGDSPRYAINGNYSPIIDHLIADGVITERFDGYRYSYTVNKEKVEAIYNGTAWVEDMGLWGSRSQTNAAPVVTAIRIAQNSTYGARSEVKDPTLLEKLQAMEIQLASLTAQVRQLIEISK
jgi:hypothetical protein